LSFGDAVLVGPHGQALDDGAYMSRAGLKGYACGRRADSCFK
jgi:hypothetical protein